jgi:tRNA (mo5U34)-methyltransferase
MTPPQTAEIYVQLAQCRQSQGDLVSAETYYRQAVEFEECPEVAYRQLGTFLRHSWRQRETPAIFLQGLKATGSPLLRQALEELDYLPSEIDEAVARGTLPELRAIPDDPDFPPVPIEDLRRRVNSHAWFHTINLGGGIVTPGIKTRSAIACEADAIFAPISVRNRSLADIGAWNGCFTVEAKRRGASRILAIDDFTWAHPEFRGKESFDLVMTRLGIEVESRIADIQSTGAAAIGQWQVVLCLGVFYHLLNPIAAVQRLAEVTAEVLVLETHLDLRDMGTPAMAFYPGTELGGDPTNWWGPNRAAVEALLKTVGFAKVLFGPNPLAPETRGLFHAFKSEALYREHAAAAGQGSRGGPQPGV